MTEQCGWQDKRGNDCARPAVWYLLNAGPGDFRDVLPQRLPINVFTREDHGVWVDARCQQLNTGTYRGKRHVTYSCIGSLEKESRRRG